MKHVRLFAVLLAATLVVAACAKPPEEVIDQARQALRSAEGAGAATYAPESWNRAKQAEAALETELEAQGGRLALLRGYKKAAALAEELAAAATQAAAEATRKTADLRTELTGAMSELRSLLQTARNRLASIPTTVRIDRTGLRARLNAAAERIDQAQRSLDAGRFDEALSGSAEARESVRAVLRTIEAAAPSPPSRKR